MRNILIALALTAAFATAHAQAPTKELTPQQKLMGTCNKAATGLKGDERKKKMSTCLADGKKRQQEVMKACATQNKGKKGEEYKAAQKDCLSKG
jgi:hypothetical protein